VDDPLGAQTAAAPISTRDLVEVCMRSVLLASLATAATFVVATSALADPVELVSNAVASVTGGCNGCGQRDDKTVPTTDKNYVLHSYAQDLAGDGSFGHAEVTTKFGEQHVYADAFMAVGDPGPDVQTQAYSRYVEHFAAGAFANGVYNLTFAITGSLSAQPDFGPGSSAYLNWDFEDITHPQSLSFGTWIAGTNPSPIVLTIPVPVGDETTIRVDFVASAYEGLGQDSVVRYADFSHTAHTYFDAVGGGPDVIGESGHDYATPKVGGVPEPSSWALMLAGFVGMGAMLRRRGLRTATA
jgi:hypothetical protein